MQIAAGNLRVKVSIQRVEGNIERLHASFAQRRRHRLPGRSLTREQRPVRRKSETHYSGDFWNFTDEIDAVASRERFAAGHGHFGYTEIGRDPNESQRFFIAENFVAPPPFLQPARDSVVTSRVATL